MFVLLQIYSEMRVLLALFSYVKANEMVGSPLTVVPSHDWTAAQYEEIQLLAMSALCTLAPLMIDDYIECHGGTRLLLMLEWCVINGTTVSCVDYGWAASDALWVSPELGMGCQCKSSYRFCRLFTVSRSIGCCTYHHHLQIFK